MPIKTSLRGILSIIWDTTCAEYAGELDVMRMLQQVRDFAVLIH
jgi:hypothetical protein